MTAVSTVPRPIPRPIARPVPEGFWGNATLSDAMTFLDGADGLALLFDSDEYYADTGFPGSAAIVGGGSQDGYDSSPDAAASSLLTYTSPSVKMTMGPSGTLRFNAHNLFLNSASPANQSVTVVSGATYSIILTGSVTTTLSGAATGTITAGTTNITAATTTLTFGSTSGTGTVQVTRTPADLTYLATAGSARYALPYEWSTAGVLQGIRVEEARTNLVTYSQSPANAAWVKVSTTATDNAVAGPTGLTDAATIFEVAGDFDFKSVQTPTKTWANAASTFSVYAKANGRNWAYVVVQDSAGTLRTAWFDLANGAVGTVQTNLTASIQSVGSGWYRCIVNVTSPNFGSVRETIGLASADNSTQFGIAGDASKGICIWGAQWETGALATSYIPTIGSTVTRAADNISLATSAFPYSATDGTLVASFNRGNKLNNPYVVSLNNGGYAELITLYGAGTTLTGLVLDNSASQASISAGTVSLLADANAAIAFSANDFAAVVNGGSIVTDVSGTIPTPTTLSMGGPAGQEVSDMLIKRVIYYPTRKANAELQTLTT